MKNCKEENTIADNNTRDHRYHYGKNTYSLSKNKTESPKKIEHIKYVPKQNSCVKNDQFINLDFCPSYGNVRPQATEIAVGSADSLQQKTTKDAGVCNNLNSTLTFSTLFTYSEDRDGLQNDKGEV